MKNHFVFFSGLHRSGTSLLHRILREHPDTSGFSNTRVSEDEGQLLQSVIPPAWVFGGPGRFGFNRESHMDESHPLATPASGAKLFRQWSRHWDLSKRYLVEKSPPNLVRTRFIQSVFPHSSFITTIRHPIPVSLSTLRRWNPSSLESLLEHWLVCHRRFFSDLPHLERIHVLRYEELAAEPRQTITAIQHFLGLEAAEFEEAVDPTANTRYFEQWDSLPDREALIDRFEHQFEPFGYSLSRRP